MADQQQGTNIFSSMTDAEIDNVASYGGLSPDMAAQIKAARAPKVLRPDPTPVPMSLPEQDEVVTDRISAMQTGTPMAQPTMYPTPLAPPHGQVDPAADMMANQEATRQVAAQKAADLQARKQAQDETQRAEAAALQDAQDEAKVKADMEQGGSNWGSKIGQAIAIMMGAYSQGLTGSKTNPAVEAIEKEMERQAASRKYTDEQKLKLAEMLYKQAQLDIERRKATVDSMVGLRKLEQADQDIAIKLEELQLKKGAAQQLGKTRFTKEEVMSLGGEGGKDLRERMVRLPDGSYAPSLSAEDAKKLRSEFLPQTANALKSLDNLEKLTNYFGNNPAKKVLSRSEIGKAQQDVQALVGAIRLEYFGPGILTDNEQEIARSMIGNPSKFFSLSSANKAKILNMKEKMKFSRRERLRESGVDLPLTRNEQILEQAMQKYPNAQKGEVINALIQQGKWDRTEE